MSTNFAISLAKATKLGFSVNLIHRDSPKSPLYDNSTTPFQKMQYALRRSAKRWNHFFPNAETNQHNDDPETDIEVNGREYLMEYALGTPEMWPFGFVDTGSDLLWLQCLPCLDCYEQNIGFFHTINSSSFGNVYCSSKRCNLVKQSFCVKNICCYRVSYADGVSVSMGNISHDTVTLRSSSSWNVKFPNFIFGCDVYNMGKFSPWMSGIIGLGSGPTSLVTQIRSSIDAKFSYCLPPHFSAAYGKLKFGRSAVLSGFDIVFTPLVLKDSFYYLTLEAISVGGKRIGIKPVEEGNIIIDSGSTLTLLPPEFYSQLEATVRGVVDPISDHVDPPSVDFNLCYLAEKVKDVGVPTITVHFRGVDVVLDEHLTFTMVDSEIACFAFGSHPNLAIYGNMAQFNFMVAFDLWENRVSFQPMDCTKLN